MLPTNGLIDGWMAEEDADALIAAGGMPTPDRLVTSVSVDLETNIALDENGYGWNILAY